MKKVILLTAVLLPLYLLAQPGEALQRITIFTDFSLATQKVPDRKMLNSGAVIPDTVTVKNLLFAVNFGYKYQQAVFQFDSKIAMTGEKYFGVKAGVEIPLSEKVSLTPLFGYSITLKGFSVSARFKVKDLYIIADYTNTPNAIKSIGFGFGGFLFQK